MNNSIKFIFMYLVTISLCCNGADKQLAGYRSIPFNHIIIDQPSCIRYGIGKNFAIGGKTGFEIQLRENLSAFQRLPGYWNVSKDDKKVVAFSPKNIFIVDLDTTNDPIRISMQEENIKCVALDSAKNIIFMGNCYSLIRRHDYSSGVHHDFNLNKGVWCCSMALTPKKDILCLLDSGNNIIALRKTDNLAVVFKEIKLPEPFGYSSCIFSPDGTTLAIGCRASICIIDNYVHCNDIRCYDIEDSKQMIQTIAFHPCGLLVALLSERNDTLIKYLSTSTKKIEEIATTILPGMIGHDFCFRDDGLELAIASYNDCIAGPVSLEVLKQYILPSLWMKLKIINMPRDIIAHSMNAFMVYCGKKKYVNE